MSGLDQAGEFGSRNERDVSRPFASNDDSFLAVDNLIQKTGQIVAQIGVGGFR
jgi:hypothetical protein